MFKKKVKRNSLFVKNALLKWMRLRDHAFLILRKVAFEFKYFSQNDFYSVIFDLGILDILHFV